MALGDKTQEAIKFLERERASGRLAKLNQGRPWWRTEIARNIFIMRKRVKCPLSSLLDNDQLQISNSFFSVQVNGHNAMQTTYIEG